MTNYYFDTSVWLNYLNPEQFYNREAKTWFQTIKESGNVLFISSLIDKEIRESKKEDYKNYVLSVKRLTKLDKIRIVRYTDKQHDEAIKSNEKKDLGLKDFLHLILVRDNDLKGVTVDISHWPQIAREFGVEVLYITDVYL